MSIAISLSPEVEAKLRERAEQQGQEVSLLAGELLAQILELESQESEEAIEQAIDWVQTMIHR